MQSCQFVSLSPVHFVFLAPSSGAHDRVSYIAERGFRSIFFVACASSPIQFTSFRWFRVFFDESLCIIRLWFSETSIAT